MCVHTCLLRGDQAVLGRAEDAADEAELVHGELGSLGDLLLLQQAADGQTPAVAARPAEGEQGVSACVEGGGGDRGRGEGRG